MYVCWTLIYKKDDFIVMVTGIHSLERSNTFGHYDRSILSTWTLCLEASVSVGFSFFLCLQV